MSLSPKQELALLLEEKQRRLKARRWRDDPSTYLVERLQLEMWDKFYEICELVRPGTKICIKSANGVGKTEIVAALANYLLECFDDSRIICTGSNWTSLKNVLFPRIHKFITKCNLHPSAVKNDLEIKYPMPEHDLVAKSTNDEVGIAGFHASFLVQIVEEASGLPERIATAIDGNNVDGRGIEIWIGNPLINSGPFYERCNDPSYKLVTISAFDHPNVKTGKRVIGGAVERKTVEDRARRWCKACAPRSEGAVHLWWLGDDGWYIPDFRFRARVMGEFPEEVEGALFPRSALKAASERPQFGGPPTALGCDVARSPVGDETVITLANAYGVTDLWARQGNDVIETGKWILEILAAHPTVTRVAVDDSGVGGGVTDFIRHQDLETIDLMPINFGAAPILKEDNFLNLKAEIHWKFKDRLLDKDTKLFLPDDPELLDQASQIKPDFSLSGSHVKIKVEDKQKYKARTGRSPDRIESCIIALHASEYAESASVPDVYLPGSAEYTGDTDYYGGNRVHDRDDYFDRRSYYEAT